MANLSAVLYGANDLRLENRPVPKPKDDEVLIEMSFVGICGSDLHFYRDGRIGEYIVKEPMVCGHEASGVVVQTGKAVTSLRKGDRVAVEPGLPCRRCEQCGQGRYNLCGEMIFCSCPPVHGTLSRYFAHPADFCFKLPDNVSLEEGALLEPLAVAVHACKRAGLELGSRVLITGAGTIGMVVMFVAKVMGASAVLVTDIQETRISSAKQLGADHVLLVPESSDMAEVATQIRTILDSDPDVTFDCSGSESAMVLALHATKRAGVIVQVGLPMHDVKVPLIQSLFKEIDIRGSMRYAHAYPAALSLAASKKVPLESLITARFQLENAVEAFQVVSRGSGLKVLINCDAQQGVKE